MNRIALPIILWHPFASGMAISPHRSRSRISSKRGPVAFQIPMPDRCISLARDQDGYRAGHDQPDVRSSRNGFWRNHVCAGPSMPRDVRTADAASLGFDRGFHARSVRAGTSRGKARHGLRRVPVRPAFARYHGFVDTRFFPRREAGTRIKQYIPTTCEYDRLA